MRRRIVLALGLALILMSQSQAVTSRIYRHSAAADLLKGEIEHVVVSSRGSLQLGLGADVLTEAFDQVWSVNSIIVHGGSITFGTSPNGGVYRYNFGTLTQIYPLNVELPATPFDKTTDSNDLDQVTNEHVFALGTDMTGRLLAGFSGKACRLCRFSSTGVEVIFRPKDALYIFDITTDEAGNIYVATGPEGKVYRLDALGKTAQLLYASRDKNILSLAAGGDGFVYAGSDDRGLVYKLNPRNQSASVLYDSSKPEISSVLFGNDLDPSTRDLYAIATSAKVVKTENEFAASTPLPGRPESAKTKSPPAAGTEGGFKLKIANTKKESSAKPSSRPAPTRKRGPSETTSTLYRIDQGGYVTDITSKMAVFLCLAQIEQGLLIGTGNKGQVLLVDPVAEQQSVLYEDEQASQITSIGISDKDIYLGTANPAKLIRLRGDYAPRGTFVSSLIDAGQPARWGKLQIDADLPAGCKVLVSSRSGNVKDVNDPTFSSWTAPVEITEPVQLKCPLGRFCQYKLILESGTGDQTPLIREIAVASTVPNLAPVVRSVDVSREAGASKRGMYTIQYKAQDANKDVLVYSIYFRKAGRSQWIKLKDKVKGDQITWDGRTVEDGRYEIRVVASDHQSNTSASKRTASRVSDAVVIDNTGPLIRGHFIEKRGQKTVFGLLVRDMLSVISKLDYTVDSHDEWNAAVPDDLVYDTTDENFTIEIADLEPGEHVIAVRIQDDLGNVTYRSFETTEANN
jgi:hypothetical protein